MPLPRRGRAFGSPPAAAETARPNHPAKARRVNAGYRQINAGYRQELAGLPERPAAAGIRSVILLRARCKMISCSDTGLEARKTTVGTPLKGVCENFFHQD
jgi:hypothetical protein